MPKTIEEHAGYLLDRIKLERYRSAIAAAVQSEHRVMDLGCGSGVLGLMALRAGAGKVIFVEESEIIEVARRTVADAGFSDKAEFYRSNSFELALSEPVDVVVCDHVGYFGFDYGLLDLLADARQRFLKPGGTLIPARLEIQLSLVESVACRKVVAQWRDGSVPEDYRWLDEIAANSKYAKDFTQDDLLAGVATLGNLDLATLADPFLTWKAEFECARDGKLDGVAGSFNCLLHDDIYMTNSPAAADMIYRPQAYLPLQQPVSVTSGEQVLVTIMARHRDHVIGWIVELPEQNRTFSNNTFNGLFLDRAALTRAHPNRTAALNLRGRAKRTVLSYCDGSRTVAEVEALVKKDHPDLFPSKQAMSLFVTEVLAWDTGE